MVPIVHRFVLLRTVCVLHVSPTLPPIRHLFSLFSLSLRLFLTEYFFSFSLSSIFFVSVPANVRQIETFTRRNLQVTTQVTVSQFVPSIIVSLQTLPSSYFVLSSHSSKHVFLSEHIKHQRSNTLNQNHDILPLKLRIPFTLFSPSSLLFSSSPSSSLFSSHLFDCFCCLFFRAFSVKFCTKFCYDCVLILCKILCFLVLHSETKPKEEEL